MLIGCEITNLTAIEKRIRWANLKYMNSGLTKLTLVKNVHVAAWDNLHDLWVNWALRCDTYTNRPEPSPPPP
jgi:hypothetical protein